MPPKLRNEMNVRLMSVDGITLSSMDEITEVHFDSEAVNEETQNKLDILSNPGELKLSFNMSVTPEDLFLIWSGVCTRKQIMQNNWRRLHGLPMRRKRHGKYVRVLFWLE